MHKKGILIGVSGASGSGKSTFSELLAPLLPNSYYLSADNHYLNPLPTMVSPADGQEYPDWNHPTSIDTAALLDKIYDAVKVWDYVVLDGAFLFCIPEVLKLIDYKIYIDATIETRFYRRISRNLKKGQTLEFIAGYYLNCARFREKEFSLKSRACADLLVNNENSFHGMEEKAAEIILSLHKDTLLLPEHSL